MLTNLHILLLVLILIMPDFGYAVSDDLKIIEPKSGVIVYPGDELIVRVTNKNSSIVRIALTGNLLGRATKSQIAEKTTEFKISISKELRAGKYRLAVVDLTDFPMEQMGRNQLRSTPIIISVLPREIKADSPLSSEPRELYLKYIGYSTDLRIIISFGQNNSQFADLNGLANLKSLNKNIAEVVYGAEIRAAGAGKTFIEATFGSSRILIPVTVAQNMKGDLDGNKIVDTDDLHILQSRGNIRSLTPKDERDLDGDGFIDKKDQEILKQLCTYKECGDPQ